MKKGKERPFIVLTEEQEYQYEIVFQTFDKGKTGKLATDLIGDICVCLGHRVNQSQLGELKKFIDKTGSGYFIVEKLKELMSSEMLYDFKFQPIVEEKRVVECLEVFGGKKGVEVEEVIKGVGEVGGYQLGEMASIQFKKDLEKCSKGGILDSQKFAKLIS